jgi:hypothetical protein
MADLLIYETGSGGDANILSNDFELTDGLFNHVYFGLFGGNPDFISTNNNVESEQNFDWWGNNLFFNNDPDQQFNSYTENILNTISLTSQSREIIKGFVQKDLEFLSNLAEISVEVFITDVDKVTIQIKLQEPSNQQNKEFQFVWDSTKTELIEKRII